MLLTPVARALSETPERTLARLAAGALALAAAAVHLAQIGPHSDEDPLFGLFFLIVGLAQVGGGVYLLRPVGPPRMRRAIGLTGMIGSIATIAIWAVSRSTGLPFGAEPGSPETVGLADAAADLFEAFTALMLAVWIGLGPRSLAVSGAVGALALAGLWVLTRALGAFDADPRLVLSAEFVDAAAVGFLLLMSAVCVHLILARRVWISYALLGTTVVTASALVVFTIPARGGQNRDCANAPIREDSGRTHAKPTEEVRIAVGETTSIVALVLVACADAPVVLTAVKPIGPRSEAGRIDSIGIDPTRGARSDRVRPSGAGSSAIGALLEPGKGRYPVVVEIRGISPGAFVVNALRLDYGFKGRADFTGFATSVFVCVGDGPCPRPLGR